MPGRNDKKWLGQFEVYKRYVGENLRFPPSLAVYEGFKIGQWFRNQITAYQVGSLTDYRKALMDGFQPAWCGSEEAKKEAMRQMALGFEWSSRVPEGRTPIDRVFQDGELLGACLKAKLYDVETYFHMSNHLPEKLSAREKALFSQENCQEAFQVLFPTFGAGHIRLFQDVFGFEGSDNFEKACYFFKDHIRSFPEGVEYCLDTLTNRENLILRELYGIGCEQRSLCDVSLDEGVTRNRICQIRDKAVSKLRHPSRAKHMVTDYDNDYPVEGFIPERKEVYHCEYDDHGNLIFQSRSNAYWGDGSVSFWEKNTYDRYDRIISSENSNGEWERNEYNDTERLVFSERSDGWWERREYDPERENRLISYADSNGFSERYVYPSDRKGVPGTSIEELDLPGRAYNALHRAGIRTVEDLVARSWGDLRVLDDVGPITLSEIEEKLGQRGLRLALESDVFSGLRVVQAVDLVAPDINSSKMDYVLLNRPIAELGLSARALNCLFRADVRTIRNLADLSREDLLHLRNFGQGSLCEVELKLAEMGLRLASEFDEIETACEEVATNRVEAGSPGGNGSLEDLIAAAEGVKMEVPGGGMPGGRGEPGGR